MYTFTTHGPAVHHIMSGSFLIAPCRVTSISETTLRFGTSTGEVLSLPGPAVVPPTAARALEKKVAMFCSFAVGGKPPTYTRLACLVACCEGGCAAHHKVAPSVQQIAEQHHDIF